MHQGVIIADKTGHDGRVILREVRGEDFATLAEMRRDREMQSLLLTVPEATDDAAVRGWIERRCAEAGGGFRVIADAATDAAVGYAQVSQVHRRNRVGYGGIALARSARGRGFGRASLWLLVDYAGRELGLTKMLSEIRADNEAALKMNYAVGFRPVGLIDQHFRDVDATYDVVLLQRHLNGDGS
ncbi:UDP-4-amino-4,6-dideoxy-N-acetyl-beta-L-altrosamine N-acetyltransferase [Azorhizobium oxalatiphilum]|uniref:UDP-4-amino-4, 6-dideoxy-N-acetyl-beta-L-altrosamine N-acetyltransferase n=1 Tax=Azorhizobium oxalatiphilum TaxID=980631 RepID=A0A917F592_9HYPH|nr:GNAT family protein [Azorhizobium oxalatiphilum]GGF49433.1 UDP-4-amino-4,6-dideoxy-N-acetyl-beta-L-altrosamine N-acetyltransferase [Azorhizobium oxalatiphilum]